MEKYRRVMFHDTEEWCKAWRKTDSWFNKWHEAFGEFSPNHSKVWKFHCGGLFLSKLYMRFELKKYRGVIFHDTEQWYKIWIKPDLVVSKMEWGIWWTFTRALKVWKIDELFLSKAYNVSARKFQRNYLPWH